MIFILDLKKKNLYQSRVCKNVYSALSHSLYLRRFLKYFPVPDSVVFRYLQSPYRI